MKCPRCQAADLVESAAGDGGVKLDVCRGCKGIWFDREELEKVLGVAAKELGVPTDAPAARKACPRCGTRLYRFKYPQTLVNVDMCGNCEGLWLDAGEFQEIRAVRQKLKAKGELEEQAPVVGVKGGLLRFVDEAIESLKLW